ncbi:MAG TPA: YHS domain-containing (seleno)protein [Chitinophagaceae bacterium]|nr:YHS domain-containing (seleno)protein [Chitinophagaceae bacterium]HPH31064.1 YHS domain-containing (seleno)protein [Chitinophagaceae bacterium]HPN58014.1 YHS domain-containing (seleno)protein [Chitinophagaceae bacterium]
MTKKVVSTLVTLLFTGLVIGQPVKYNSKNGIAIKGFDPVAYFTLGKAVKGLPEISFNWSGSTWLFSTKAHLDSFSKHPEKYAPQYGGYCAYGCSENHLSPTDPEAWTIINNKLYLNYNLRTRVVWLQDTVARIKNADIHWPVLNH